MLRWRHPDMRILISALLLALSGNKNDSKCSTGEEMTSSYIPAGLQVLNHYLTQMRVTQRVENPRSETATPPPPDVPMVIITYHPFDASSNSSANASKSVGRLETLAAALNAEAKDQGLAECRGFTTEVLRDLESNSKSTSAHQLVFILRNINAGEMKRSVTKVLVKGILTDLEKCETDLCRDLENVPPLKYLSDLSLERLSP